jgi:hypothetical protein
VVAVSAWEEWDKMPPHIKRLSTHCFNAFTMTDAERRSLDYYVRTGQVIKKMNGPFGPGLKAFPAYQLISDSKLGRLRNRAYGYE